MKVLFHIPHVFRSRALFVSLAIVVVLSIMGFGIYKIITLQSEVQKMKNSPKAAQEAQKEEATKLVDRVRTLIAVPTDEQPTVATVTDIEKLKNQPFFASAQTGDKVLIYTVAKKAILYRPSENKIIEVSPVTIGSSTATNSSSLKENVRFALYNGTSTVGLTKKIEPVVKAKISNATVVLKENAAKNDYTETLFIDVTGQNSAKASEFAKLLGFTVGSLPAGEALPKDVEYLILLGSDVK